MLASAAISLRLTASHPNSEVKRGRAEVVLRWGTTREGSVLHFFFARAAHLFCRSPCPCRSPSSSPCRSPAFSLPARPFSSFSVGVLVAPSPCRSPSPSPCRSPSPSPGKRHRSRPAVLRPRRRRGQCVQVCALVSFAPSVPARRPVGSTTLTVHTASGRPHEQRKLDRRPTSPRPAPSNQTETARSPHKSTGGALLSASARTP